MSSHDLYFVSSISWAESCDEEIINHAALPKYEYVSVPSELSGDEINRFIDHKLYESTTVQPWYYNLDKLEIIP